MERISKTLLLCFLLLLSGRVFSQGTTLVIFSDTGQKFTLEVNGAIQNDSPEARVETNNLFGPAIKVKLYPADEQLPPVSKSIFNTPNGMLYYVYQQDAKGRYILEKTTHDWSGEEPPSEPPPPPPPPPDEKASPTPTGSGNCANPLSIGEFQASLELISRQPFDGPKLTSAKNLAKGKCLTSEQVSQVIYTFDNEGTRLQFAKYAYPFVYDPSNYDLVRETLDAGSQNALNDYIREIDKQ